MRKIFCTLITCVVFAVAAQAQQVYKLDRAVRDGLRFIVYAGDKSLPISPFLYKKLKEEPAGYFLIDYQGENGSARTLVHRTKVSYAVLEVDSIGLDENDVAEVYLSDKTIYKSPNNEWLKVQIGQHVERWLVDGETKIIVHYRTVPREIPLTTDLPYAVPSRELAAVTTQPVAVVKPPVTTTQPVVVTTPPANNTATRPALVRR